MSFRFLGKLVCAVFLCTAFARADEHGAETPATDSTQAKNASDNGAAPAEGNTLKVTTENILSIVSIVLPHNALKNSESLHDWPFLAFAVPAWGYNLKLQQDYGKALSLKGLAAGDVNFAGFGIKLDASVELIHLLELGVQTSRERPSTTAKRQPSWAYTTPKNGTTSRTSFSRNTPTA